MSDRATEDLVRRFHHELWGEQDASAIQRYVAADAAISMTGSVATSVDALREDVERYAGAFTDISTDIVELVVAGDRAVLWWCTHGRHVGPYGDIAPAPTGKRITMEGVDALTVRDERIVAIRSMWDAAAVYRQFGLLPEGL
jgi:predicted ester cyclase